MKKFLFLLIPFLFSCQGKPLEEEFTSIYSNASYGAVVSAHPLATKVGMDILEAGGNAFDAAIAVQMSLAVVFPRAGNIGGGGFMVYHLADGKSGSLDYRETAAAMASRDMYLDSLGNHVKDKSEKGALSVGVPGSVAGMWETHQRFATLDWSELISPAIKQAKEGFPISKRTKIYLNSYRSDLLKYNGSDFYLVNDNEWQEGDSLQALNLATTLDIIAQKGREGFYKGEIAEAIVKTMQKHGGIIALEDLSNYKVVWRDVIAFDFQKYTIISMPLPSSGGIALAQLLHGFTQFRGDTMALNSSHYIHLNTELQRRVFADRAEYLGDADFIEVSVDALIDSLYLTHHFSAIDLEHASLSQDVKHGEILQESLETTHLSILDRWGNAVSITTTLNGAYGSKLACIDAGFMLNNEMDDFSSKAGVPNQFGLVGSEANSIEGGKRMLSSMTPTIVLQDNKPVLILGSPGGSRIITSVYQTILNSLVYKLDAQESVNSPRYHSQWLPDALYYEEQFYDSLLLDSLQKMGHHVYGRERNGRVKMISVIDGFVEAAGDSGRTDDSATVR